MQASTLGWEKEKLDLVRVSTLIYSHKPLFASMMKYCPSIITMPSSGFSTSKARG